jgi:hypothetical protein
MRILFNNTISKREIDSNGFLIAKDCAILRTGILNYRDSELGGNTNKIVKAFLSREEMSKGMETLGNKPVLPKHSFIGSLKGGKDKPIGSIGDSLKIEDRADGLSYLIGNICITDEDSVDEIVKHKREQLSAGYTGDLVKSENPNYDYEVKNIVFNHIALCKKGRCGSEVAISNSEDEENILLINEEDIEMTEEKEKVCNACGGTEIKDEKKELKEEKKVEEKKEEEKKDEVKKEVENEKVEEKKEEKEEKTEEKVEDKKDEDKKEEKVEIKKEEEKIENEIKVSDGKREYDLKEIVKVLLDEVGYHKEHPVDDKSEKKEVSNSIDDMRIQIANEIKEENNKKFAFYNSIKEYVGNIEILNYDLSELANKSAEKLGLNLKDNMSVNERVSFVNGYVEGLKANSINIQNENACNHKKGYKEVIIKNC